MEQNQEYNATQTGAKVTGIGCSAIVCLVIGLFFVFEWKHTPAVDQERERVRAAQTEALRSGQSVSVSLSKEEIDSLPALEGEELLMANSPIVASETELRKNAIKIVPLAGLPEPLPQGSVQVQIIVSEQGNVFDAKVISGDAESLLGKAAMESARQWQFKPFTHLGATVKVVGKLTFGYTSK
ncbi:MAG: TonB family protein [Acidobacteria bacterium]|nr:TonB family protein [Acidobacteriota bacterium]